MCERKVDLDMLFSYCASTRVDSQCLEGTDVVSVRISRGQRVRRGAWGVQVMGLKCTRE